MRKRDTYADLFYDQRRCICRPSCYYLQKGQEICRQSRTATTQSWHSFKSRCSACAKVARCRVLSSPLSSTDSLSASLLRMTCWYRCAKVARCKPRSNEFSIRAIVVNTATLQRPKYHKELLKVLWMWKLSYGLKSWTALYPSTNWNNVLSSRPSSTFLATPKGSWA